MMDRWELPGGLTGMVASLRVFRRLGVVAVHADESIEPLLRNIPGALHVVKPGPLPPAPVGKWYVNLLAGWEQLIERLDTYEGAVVNLSLGPPPGSGNTFEPHEALNRATWVAHEHGILVVVAAGNDGEQGDDTMSRWAKAPWVVSVGASDRKGRRIEKYSSRGVPGERGVRPTVIAPGFRDPLVADPRDTGTSFAAQQVTEIAHLLQRFAASARKASAIRLTPLGEARPMLAHFVRTALHAMAVPIPAAEPHECGDGFVSVAVARRFLENLTGQDMQRLLDLPDPPGERDIRAAKKSLRGSFNRDDNHRLARASIDTSYEWSRPTFVPGLVRKRDGYWLFDSDRFEYGEDVDIGSVEDHASSFINVSIEPRHSRGRELIVTRGNGAFPTIGAALAEAREWDVIRVRAGVYEEAVTLKSGVTIKGDDGAVIRHASQQPVSLSNLKSVSLSNLEIVSQAAQTSAIWMYNSSDIALERCRVHAAGNSMTAVSVSRCVVKSCEFRARANAVYLVSCRDIAFRSGSYLIGAKNGVLLYGSSGRFVGCSVQADEADAIIFIPPRKPWMRGGKMRVFVGDVGTLLVRPRRLKAWSPQRDDIVGTVALHLYGLLVEDTQLVAGHVALAATTLEPVAFAPYYTDAAWSDFALIRGPQTIPVKIAGLAVGEALQVVQKTLNPLTYTKTSYAPLPPTSFFHALDFVRRMRWMRWLIGSPPVE
jgi:hypothetical protein